MLRFLVAVDGSENSDRAVDYLLKQLGRYKDGAEVHLINVQPSFSSDIARFIDQKTIKDFHQEQGSKALEGARAKMEAAQVRVIAHVGVGEAGHVITSYAAQHRCEQIFLGTRGLGSVAGMLLGSVTTKVVHLSSVPVTLVK
jgi:nucleotide-binding universal stress UspA family protein